MAREGDRQTLEEPRKGKIKDAQFLQAAEYFTKDKAACTHSATGLCKIPVAAGGFRGGRMPSNVGRHGHRRSHPAIVRQELAEQFKGRELTRRELLPAVMWSRRLRCKRSQQELETLRTVQIEEGRLKHDFQADFDAGRLQQMLVDTVDDETYPVRVRQELAQKFWGRDLERKALTEAVRVTQAFRFDALEGDTEGFVRVVGQRTVSGETE